jgi:hypothetical protein
MAQFNTVESHFPGTTVEPHTNPVEDVPTPHTDKELYEIVNDHTLQITPPDLNGQFERPSLVQFGKLIQVLNKMPDRDLTCIYEVVMHNLTRPQRIVLDLAFDKVLGKPEASPNPSKRYIRHQIKSASALHQSPRHFGELNPTARPFHSITHSSNV